MRKLWLTGSCVLLLPLLACDKTGKGEYEIKTPAVGTKTDTIHMPRIETGTTKDTITVPDVDVTTKRREVTLPKVEVKKPNE